MSIIEISNITERMCSLYCNFSVVDQTDTIMCERTNRYMYTQQGPILCACTFLIIIIVLFIVKAMLCALHELRLYYKYIKRLKSVNAPACRGLSSILI